MAFSVLPAEPNLNEPIRGFHPCEGVNVDEYGLRTEEMEVTRKPCLDEQVAPVSDAAAPALAKPQRMPVSGRGWEHPGRRQGEVCGDR